MDLPKGLSVLSVQDETGQSQRPHPANSWAAAGAVGRGEAAGLQGAPPSASLAPPVFSPPLLDSLFSERGGDRRPVFVSFLFSF